jgi:hypothetical protein
MPASWLDDVLREHPNANLDRKPERDRVVTAILAALPRRAMMIAVLSSLIRQAYEMDDPSCSATPKDVADAVVTAIADLLEAI